MFILLYGDWLVKKGDNYFFGGVFESKEDLQYGVEVLLRKNGYSHITFERGKGKKYEEKQDTFGRANDKLFEAPVSAAFFNRMCNKKPKAPGAPVTGGTMSELFLDQGLLIGATGQWRAPLDMFAIEVAA